MNKTGSAGGIVLNDRGEVALVKNGPDFWGLPKGHVDPGEDTLAAAKREIYEETGITELSLVREYAPYMRFRGKPDGGDDMTEEKTIYMFLFTTTQDKLEPQDTSNPEARWYAPSEVGEMLTHPRDREFFRGADLTH